MPNALQTMRIALERYLKHMREEEKLLAMCKHGISQLVHRVGLFEAVSALNALDDEDYDEKTEKERLELIRQEAQFAQEEVDSDFPLLNAHAVVSVWGTLEVYVDDLLVAWVMNEPRALMTDKVQAIRISLAEYHSLRHEDQMRYLIHNMRENQKPRRFGVDAFESLFLDFGIDSQLSPLSAELRQTLIEMYQTRNVLVHRGSVIDRRFVQLCPWTNRTIGDHLSITTGDVRRYANATSQYAVIPVKRVLKHYGHAIPDALLDAESDSNGGTMIEETSQT